MKTDKIEILGNILISISIISLIYIYFPIIKTEYNYRTNKQTSINTAPVSSEFNIIINKIGINLPVIANTNPFNPSIYQQVLKTGVAHALGSGLPNSDKTVYLFGHSSDNPFSITRYNTSFYLLNKLTTDDEITIYYKNNPYHYKVTGSKVVTPDQVDYLLNTSAHQLILQTCTPIGTSLNRLLVFATQKPNTLQ